MACTNRPLIVQRSDPPRRIFNDVHVELHRDIAMTRGDLDIRYQDNRPDLFMRYVRVYRQTGSDWRAISHRTVYATDRKPQAESVQGLVFKGNRELPLQEFRDHCPVQARSSRRLVRGS